MAIDASPAAGPVSLARRFLRRTRLGPAVLRRLAGCRRAGLAGSRSARRAVERAGPRRPARTLPLFGSPGRCRRDIETTAGPRCRRWGCTDRSLADYQTTGLSLRAHPLSFLREKLEQRCIVPAARLATLDDGVPVRVAGLVLVRQRPATASGITFVTLEDETGVANLIVRPDVWRRFFEAASRATILIAQGRLQRQGEIIHVLVTRLEDFAPRSSELRSQSRDFR